MRAHSTLFLAVLLAAAATASACSRSNGTVFQGRSPSRGVPVEPKSPEELARRVFAALQAGDRATLESFLIADQEYREVILPGSVPPGEPAQRMPKAKAEFFTRLHRTKSQYALADLISSAQQNGGELREVRWEGPSKAYAAYTLLPLPTLVVANGTEVRELRPGLFVDLGGRLRVLSYFRDD